MAWFPGCKYVYLSAFAADILAFIVGTASTWSSPILPKLQSNDIDQSPLGRKITETEVSWIGSLLAMGAIFSSVIFGYSSQKVGPKAMGIIVGIPFLISYLILAFAEIVELFYVGRIFMGFGTGGMFFSSMIYLVEIAEDSNRGLLIASTSCFLMIGMLFSFALGPFVSVMVFNLILAAICSVYIPFYWYLAPESPYFLASAKEDEKALASLRYLRRQPDKKLEEELEKIKNNLHSKEKGSLLDIFKTRALAKAFLHSVALVTAIQLAGINVFFSYMQLIFDAANSTIPPEICAIIVAIVQLLSSILSALVNDRFGRKTLLLISGVGCCCSEAILGLYFYLQADGTDTSSIGWLPVASLMVFMLFYKFGLGTLAWPMVPELLPPNLASQVILVLTSWYWIVAFLVTQYFNSLSKAIGMAGSFWLFSGCCGVFALFVFFFLFETKGKSLKEIQMMFDQ